MRLLFRLLPLLLWSIALPSFAQQAAQQATPAAGEADPTATGKHSIVQVASFYTAEVPVLSQAAGERQAALAKALGQVVIRLTGNPQASANAVIRRAAANAEGLVTESQYRQDTDTVNGGQVFKTVLVASFYNSSVDALIAGAGLKYWGGERPRPILWLAIDDGRGPRLVTGQQLNVVKPLATRGLERGMRFLLPAGTAVEQAAVASIWALDSAALQPLTARYNNDLQLIGKIYRSVSGWSAWWVLSRSGTELARWPATNPDPRVVIASGADPSADALARREAVAMDAGPAGVFAVTVDGVAGQADFVKLMGYLETMAIVNNVEVVEASPERLRLSLSLGVGIKGFRNLVDSGSVMRSAADSADGSGAAARFVLQ